MSLLSWVVIFGGPYFRDLLTPLKFYHYFWGGLLLSELYGSIYFSSDSKQHFHNYNITQPFEMTPGFKPFTVLPFLSANVVTCKPMYCNEALIR